MQPTTVKEFFRQLPASLDTDAAEDVEATYQFDLTGAQGGAYVVTIRNGACHVREGNDEEADVTLSMTGEDCIKVLAGQLSGQAVLMSGRLRVSGDIGLALQLKVLFPGIG